MARLEIAAPRCGPPLTWRQRRTWRCAGCPNVTHRELRAHAPDEPAGDTNIGKPRMEASGPAFAGPSETARGGPAARFTARWAARGEARGASRSDADPCPAGAGSAPRFRVSATFLR